MLPESLPRFVSKSKPETKPVILKHTNANHANVAGTSKSCSFISQFTWYKSLVMTKLLFISFFLAVLVISVEANWVFDTMKIYNEAMEMIGKIVGREKLEAAYSTAFETGAGVTEATANLVWDVIRHLFECK
ncbi:hypothetical protein AALO_G00254100 [Alosa alosa]|uniref:Uncharacterized protein n=1 Tax=Alosa alosa TaxID=278164 RepID=A0AAV6FNK4_9TELE|nr:hypothetical protein AALO_G00254100 [Alosa alosa]